MSRIFLSHASADNRDAIALKRWLVEQRPGLANEIFLDIDQDSGLRVGTRWKGQLFESNSRCEAVICLLSAHWETSHECKTEYRTAEGLGKQILVARLEDSGSTDITGDWQRCDLFADGATTDIEVPGGSPVRFNTAALYQLRKALEGAGVAPENFVWPPKQDPQREPYRGWEPFTDIDAGIFFGRDTAIVRGLDELRSMRFRLLATLSGQKTLFVVLGPSGSGKSSFLRAGLIPRLQREDRRFLVLGVLRPEGAALTGEQGLAAAIEAGRRAVGLTGPPLGALKAALSNAQQVCQLLADIRTSAAARLQDADEDSGAPTLVLPLDQAEELFSASAGEQAEQLLTLLAEVLSGLNSDDVGLIVAATIRTDRFEVMQNHPALDGLGTVLFDDLKAMPPTQFERVITGPAARASEGGQRLAIAPDLVTTLLADAAEGADTLPLLALTLAQLYRDYASTGQLTLAHYHAMGGMRRVVQSTVNEILVADADERAAQLQLLRAAFVPWLATINPDNDQPLRRVARYRDLPADSLPLIDALVEKRLLVRDTRAGEAVIEVALESLLRQWDELAGWLREERQQLTTADDVERNATAWSTHDHDPAWLLSGTRLTDAETLANRTGFSERLAGARNYLTASRDMDNQRLAAEEQRRQAELRHAKERQHTAESHAGAMRKRARILLAVAVVAIVAAVAAVVGFVQNNAATKRAQAGARQAVALRLVSDAADLLAQHRAGGDIRAFQELLAAHGLADRVAGAGMLDAVVARLTTAKVVDVGGAVNSVAISPDGNHIAAAADDNTIRLFDADSGQPVGYPLFGHTAAVNSVTFSPNSKRLASGSDDHTVRLWNVDTGQPVGPPLTGHTGSVRTVTFSPDGHRLASGGHDNTLRLWNVDTGQQIGDSLAGITDWVNSVAFSPDGHRLASAGRDGLKMWNADTGQPMSMAPAGPTAAWNCVAFSPDGHRLAADSEDNVQLWDADTGLPVGDPLQGHTDSVESVAFSPDGHRLVSGSQDKTVRVWNVDTGQPVEAPLLGHTDSVTGVAFAPDGHHLVSASTDHTVREWDSDPGTPLATLPMIGGVSDAVTSVAFSADGRRLASGSWDNLVRVRNADTGQTLATLKGNDNWVTSVAFSPDGHRLASGSRDSTARVWDADTGRLLVTLRGHHDTVNSVAFSPDGHRVASGSDDHTVRLWNADTGQALNTLTDHTAAVESVAFSPDGRQLASGAVNVVVSDADTGRQLRTLIGHKQTVNSVAYSPDSHWLASASDDATVRIWRPGTGQTVATLDHPKAVSSVAFAPDGQRLASGGWDNTVRLWSWNGDTVQPFGAPMSAYTTTSGLAAVSSVAFSPDGQTLAQGGYDGTIRQWPAVATRELLCSKLTTNMSRKRWHDWVAADTGYKTQCPNLPIPPDDGQFSPLPGQTQLPFDGLSHPQAITVDHSGAVYIADTGNNRLLKLPAGATKQQTLLSGLNQPDGVAVDSTGTVYVAEAGTNRILRLPAGSTQTTPVLTDLKHPTDVAVDTAGTVYVADSGNKRVLRLSAGSTCPAHLSFDDPGKPNALAVDLKQTVYVTTEENNANGNMLAIPAGAAHSTALPFTGLDAGAIAVDTAGNLYVSTVGAVAELPVGGRAPTALPFSGLKGAPAVAVDTSGNLYVADTENSRVFMRHTTPMR